MYKYALPFIMQVFVQWGGLEKSNFLLVFQRKTNPSKSFSLKSFEDLNIETKNLTLITNTFAWFLSISEAGSQ